MNGIKARDPRCAKPLPHNVRLSPQTVKRIDDLRIIGPVVISRHAILVRAIEIGLALLESKGRNKRQDDGN